MSETDRERPSATPALLALLAAGAADPAPDRLPQDTRPAQDTGPAPEGLEALEALESPHRAALRNLITDGVVELRKRAPLH